MVDNKKNNPKESDKETNNSKDTKDTANEKFANGFNKLYWNLAQKYGVEVAAVYSVISNIYKTKNGWYCDSEVSIGNELRMSYRRVNKVLNLLLDEGLIRSRKTKWQPVQYSVIPSKREKIKIEDIEYLESNKNRFKKYDSKNDSKNNEKETQKDTEKTQEIVEETLDENGW